MANLKDLIVNGTARIIGKTYSSEFVGNVTGDVAGDVAGNAATATKASQDSEGNVIKDTYFKCSGGIIDGHLDIHPTNNTAGSYDEGIRIAVGKNGYSTLVLGSSATRPSGTTDGQWWVGCNHESKPRKLFIAHNGADSSETYFYADSSTQKTPSLKVGGKITASEFVGNLTGNVTGNVSGSSGSCTGNAASATKATNDSANQQINTTYIKGLGVDGRTITYTKGDGSTNTITTQDTTYTVASGDNNGQIKITPSSGNAYNVSVKGLGSNAFNSTEYLSLAGGTVTGITSFSNAEASSSTTTGAVKISGGLGVAGDIYAGAVHNAVWNDLADRIPVDDKCKIEPGYCYCFDGERYYKSTKYLDEGIVGIDSDTYGMSMGHKPNLNQMDVAVAGFVLAYVDKEYKPGTPLTCAKNGYLTKIKLKDKIRYPERIVATYWKNESAEEWGSDSKKIKVNGRKWVKVV